MTKEDSTEEEKTTINLASLFQQQLVPTLPERSNCMVENRVYILDYMEDDYRWQVLLPLNEYIIKTQKAIENDEFKEDAHIQFFIDCGGGEVSLMWATLALMKVAKRSGIIIDTFIYGRAASAASEIAIYGDNRYMYESSYHGIHFGCEFASNVQNKHGIDTNRDRMYSNFESTLSHYLKNTKATKQQLEKWLKEEITYLNSKQCKKLGFVDKVIKE